jgi:hypothetical protein
MSDNIENLLARNLDDVFGERNRHSARPLVFSADGAKLFLASLDQVLTAL